MEKLKNGLGKKLSIRGSEKKGEKRKREKWEGTNRKDHKKKARKTEKGFKS